MFDIHQTENQFLINLKEEFDQILYLYLFQNTISLKVLSLKIE